jgi:hypothetical protein
MERLEVKRLVLLAVVAKLLVVVALVVVLFSAVKFWRVDELVTRRLLKVCSAVKVLAV